MNPSGDRPGVLSRPGIELRSWGENPGDARLLASAWRDPAVAAWTAVPKRSTGEPDDVVAARWIAGRPAREASGRVLDFVIHAADAPTDVLGEVGLVLADVDRRLVEIGYWLFPAVRGQGVATAAVALAVVEAGQPPLRARTVIARIEPDNAASSAVVARSGFVLAGRLADGRDLWRRDLPGKSLDDPAPGVG